MQKGMTIDKELEQQYKDVEMISSNRWLHRLS